jgi:hypothetical protein
MKSTLTFNTVGPTSGTLTCWQLSD